MSERVGINWENNTNIVPNQALYQAEPQPEMNEFVPQSRSLLAYFDLNRKEIARLPALLHQSTPVKSAVLLQPTSELGYSSTITLGRRKRRRFARRLMPL
jgi:hypothetical protein